LLYGPKKQQVARATINTALPFNVQPNNYAR
jgi:hypothetical protein